MSTSFSNAAGDGTVIADGFVGPITGAVTGTSITASTGITDNGIFKAPQSAYVAVGATQGTARLIGDVMFAVATATASALGIKLPVATTGRLVGVFTTGTKAPLIYPNTNAKIGTSATNVAKQLTANTLFWFSAKNTTQWYANV